MKISVSLGNLFQHLITLKAEKFSCDDTEFPCCSFGRCTSCAPSLSNQPLGCTSSPLAFSSSGKKKPLRSFSCNPAPQTPGFSQLNLFKFASLSIVLQKLGTAMGTTHPQFSQSRGSSATGQRTWNTGKAKFFSHYYTWLQVFLRWTCSQPHIHSQATRWEITSSFTGCSPAGTNIVNVVFLLFINSANEFLTGEGNHYEF